MEEIISTLDRYLEKHGYTSVGSVEANAVLAREGVLGDDALHPGFPLRQLLRQGKIPHAFQPPGFKSDWFIPHSGKSA